MKKTGILGGGQLGRMLLQQAANYPIETYVMENDAHCPAAHLCHHFTKGDIKDYDDVLNFGRQVDVLTIEIENVNVDALFQLEKEGVQIIPRPAVLKTIKNKILQKQLYEAHQIPTPAFVITESRESLKQHDHIFPAVHKIGEGGYDGRGVQVLDSIAEIDKGFEEQAILEKKVEIDKEIALMVAVDQSGAIHFFPPVEMIFNPHLNQLDFQLCPANLQKEQLWKMEAIAVKLMKAFDSPGLFALELFIDRNGGIWVNETAPRVHNSGHHTIEGCTLSQFDCMLRVMLGYPVPEIEITSPSALINWIGAPNYSGPAKYPQLAEVLKTANCFVHLYGKALSKPGRKMGHVTVLGSDRNDVVRKSKLIKAMLES